jgi:hypothetical protein
MYIIRYFDSYGTIQKEIKLTYPNRFDIISNSNDNTNVITVSDGEVFENYFAKELKEELGL